MISLRTAITANQEEKITVKIATQQKQENLASLTSIDKSVYNDTAATLTSSSSSSLKSVNNNSGGSGTSYSHSSNNNSNKSQQYQQRFHNKPQYNNNNNNHNNYGFQQQKHSTTQSPNNNGFIIEGNKNFKNIDNIKDNNNGHLNGDNKKYNINNSGINNNTNKNNVGVNNTSTNSENFSYGFSKNFAKIRQHDSDVSPRPRRPYQNDSSSRYYNKSSDGTGQGRIISGDTVNSRNIPTSIGEGGGGGSRRQFINSNIDYNNSLNQSSGYNNRSVTPPDPIKGGGFNNSNNIGGGNNIGGQQGGSYINKNHYNNYKNPYNNGRENNYYNKYNENGSGGGGAGGRPQYNRGSGNSGIGELREYSPSASPNLNGGPRLAGSLQRNIASENNRGLSNNINNRGPSYDNNGPRRPINNNNNNNYNSLERGVDRNDRDRDRDRGIDKFDRDRGFDRVGVDRDRIDRDRNERYPSEREKRFEHIDKLERGPLPPSVLRPDSRPLLSENSNNTGRQPYQGRDSGNYSPQSSSASPIGGSPKRDDIKGNGGTSKSEEKSVDRWIPPSLRSQHVLTQQDKNDAVFRKVIFI
ncbi:probable serine/threonine-protein kinase clkA [Condylostylus longicornis]|uniref:probable serine/threonine-protein kinase clkA n=1 Tax=Condylostylus longicornis TaxID=2530218 RepID=UPI00244E2A58|nr:probable serine/threonine-protein kinase clkA [Condylostylus longicornis]